MNLIKPQPEASEAKQALAWLAENKNHALDDSGLNDIVRLLIFKVNELTTEVTFLRNRVENIDRML